MPLASSLIGRDLAGYRIDSLLGRGGMSEVYRARHLTLNRDVALKILPPQLAASAGVRDRFLKESRLVSCLEHPHVVPIYEAGEAEGLLYIAMRLVEGIDLHSLLAKKRKLSLSRGTRIITQVASALDAAHQRGLIHRDVKPANILIERRGRNTSDEHAYLSDFGLTKTLGSDSRYTETGRIVGSVHYMAPEQIEGEELSEQTDVYALGCVLFECLTGTVPYQRDSDLAVLWAHVQCDVPRITSFRPELPPRLDEVLQCALAKNPEDRYRSCGDLARELRRVVARRRLATPVRRYSRPAAPTTKQATDGRPQRLYGIPRRLQISTAAALVILLSGSGVWVLRDTIGSSDRGKKVVLEDRGTAAESPDRRERPPPSRRPQGATTAGRDATERRARNFAQPSNRQTGLSGGSRDIPELGSINSHEDPRPRVSRVHTEEYTPVTLARTEWDDCHTPGTVGCIEFPTRSYERFVSVEIFDRGRGINAWLRQDIDGDKRPDGEWREFCDETTSPIRIRPGAVLNIMLMAETDSSCERRSTPTGGEIRLTFYRRI